MSAWILDSDLAIDFLRGLPAARDFVGSLTAAHVSALTVAELYAGARPMELAALQAFLSAVTILPVTAEIALLGGQFSDQYRRSHGCGLVDCVIAATAQLHDLTLYTLNVRHFPMLLKVSAPYAKASR